MKNSVVGRQKQRIRSSVHPFPSRHFQNSINMEASNLPDGYKLVKQGEKLIIEAKCGKSIKKIKSRTQLEVFHAQGQFLDLHVSVIESCLGMRRQQTMLNVTEHVDLGDESKRVKPNDGEGEGDGVYDCDGEPSDEPGLGDGRPVAKRRILPNWMPKPQVQCSVGVAIGLILKVEINFFF